jgi:hypothetical protein
MMIIGMKKRTRIGFWNIRTMLSIQTEPGAKGNGTLQIGFARSQ